MDCPVVKSPNDKKQYRLIVLPNGLTALLISDIENKSEDDADGTKNDCSEESDDAETDEESEGSDNEEDTKDDGPISAKKKQKMAAAALCIKVGSFSDPRDIPGLAHFLEHMVFMGSEKYPDENSFDAFVTKHGGSDNAFTDCELTVFKVEVNPNHFRETLDRFAQFFISPLMKKDSMDREIKAVDSEFQLSLPKDSCRGLLIFSSLAKEGHPMSNFMWGNSQTLKDAPLAKGIDVHERLREFRDRYYSSHLMTLAVQSKVTLDDLEEWVTEIFTEVPNNDLPPPDFREYTGPFDTSKMNKIIKVIPVKKVHKMIVSWSLPALQSYYKCKPLRYLGSVVGHEGPGSLLSYLRKNVWALHLNAGNDESGYDINSTHSVFYIDITLTEKGMDNIFEVLTCIFEFLEMIRNEGPQERLFAELKTIADSNFSWQEEVQPSDYVEELAECMQKYPPEHYITGDELYFEYNGEIIKECQDALLPNRANIMILSTRYKPNDGEYESERWTNAQFRIEDIPEEWMEQWNDLRPNPVFHLPEENKFIATDFEIKEPDVPESQYPVKCFEEEGVRIFYKKDNKFTVPRARAYFHLITPVISRSPLTEAMVDLFALVLYDELIESTYAAKVASASYFISSDKTGILFYLYGFNHKLHLLLETIMDQFCTIDVNDELFESLKKHQLKAYYNGFIKPGNLEVDVRYSIISCVHWNALDTYSCVKDITKGMLQSFVEEVRSQMNIEALFQGNITFKEAKEMTLVVKSKLNCSPLSPEVLEEMKLQAMEIPTGNYFCRIASFNVKDVNSSLTNYYQSGPAGIRECCLMELMMLFMSEPCFHVLRTEEQLGYSVSCHMECLYKVIGYSVSLSSPADKYSCSFIDERIESFLRNFAKKIEDTTEEEFRTHVTSLIKVKSCTDLSLQEEADRNWSEIQAFQYQFDRLALEIGYLKQLTLSEFKDWCLQHLPIDSDEAKIRKLTIQVVGEGKEALKECSFCKPDGIIVRSPSLLQEALQVFREKSSEKNLPDNCDEKPDDDTYDDVAYELIYSTPLEEEEGKYFITNIKDFKQGLQPWPGVKIWPRL